MEKEYLEILAVYPGMYASKLQVRSDTWEHFLCSMNLGEAGNCFMPCKDMEGDVLFVDMTKLLAFYELKKEPVKKNKKTKVKK